jgi:hypothetical protein
MLLNGLIVKIYYKKSLFYIITISIYENLKYMIIKENFWPFELIYYVVRKENIIYVKDWRLKMGLMLYFHIKLNYHFVFWLKKLKPW